MQAVLLYHICCLHRFIETAYQIWLLSDNLRPRYEKSYFQNCGRLPSWICENCHFGHGTYICMWFFISGPNLALIGQYVAEIQPKMIFNMASVRSLEFAKFWFFATSPSSEWKFASAYQIWSKSDNSRPRYGQNYFQNGGCPPSWIFENCNFGHVTYIWVWFFISGPSFALIGQYGAEI